MTIHNVQANNATLHVRDEGAGPTVVFAHSLGLDHTVWDGVADLMPDHRVVRYDLRGHGASSVPNGPFSMGKMVADAEAVCDTLNLKDVVFVGLSVGGLVAQGLAVKRLDLIRAIVLSNTAAKLGQPQPWLDRAKIARERGMAALVEGTMARWHVKPVPLDTVISVFQGTNPEGYAATCEAIAGTDFYTPTSGLRLPTMGLCGTRDRATPPDLVRETTELVPGSTFHLIRNAGHLPPLSQPDELARLLKHFLMSTGHSLSAPC